MSGTPTADTTITLADAELKPAAPTPGAHTTRTIPLDVSTLGRITDTAGNQISPTTDSNGDSIYSCEAEGWSYRLNQSKRRYYEVFLLELTTDNIQLPGWNRRSGFFSMGSKARLASVP